RHTLSFHAIPVVAIPLVDAVVGTDDPRGAVTANADIARQTRLFAEGALFPVIDLVSRVDHPRGAVGTNADARAEAVYLQPASVIPPVDASVRRAILSGPRR